MPSWTGTYLIPKTELLVCVHDDDDKSRGRSVGSSL